MLDGTLTREPDGGHAVIFKRRIAQPPEKLWAALTDPKLVALWFGDLEIEPRLGGRYIIRFRDMSVVMTGCITQFEPMRLLEYSWLENYGMAGSTARWEIAPDGDVSVLTLTHSFPPEIARADILSFLGGWHAFLDAIPRAVEGQFVPYAKEDESQLDANYRAELGDAPPDAKGVISQVGQITFRRTLPGPIDKVWAFLTETEKLKGWYGEGRIEPRRGGAVFLLGGHVRGVVTQWQPPHKLVYSWNVFDPTDPPDAISAYPESYLGIALVEYGGVRLTLNHLPVPERFQKQSAMGWHTFLDMIEAGLNGEAPKREDFFSRNAALYGVDMTNLKG